MHKQESAFSLWKSGWCSPPNNSPPLSCFKSSCLWLLHINKKEIFLSYSLIPKFYCTNCKVRLFKNTVFENHITCLISNFPVKYITIMLIFGIKNLNNFAKRDFLRDFKPCKKRRRANFLKKKFYGTLGVSIYAIYI